jgi:hypothetical protein
MFIQFYLLCVHAGCQLVYIHAKNTKLDQFWRDLEWKLLLYFVTIWNILWPLSIIYGRLV